MSSNALKDFNRPLTEVDEAVNAAIKGELKRQQTQIELIASENIVSQAVLDAQGSVLTNKYAEGYPGKRYYGGCHYVDDVEQLAIDRLKELFGAEYANVQPHSGSQANQAVFYSVLQPGAKILGLSLDKGGHLTHGSSVNISGKWFEPHFYGLDAETEEIDYDEVERLAHEIKPKLIIAGASAYSRTIDFECFGKIAKAVEAYLLVDMAHIAGLVAAGLHPSPMPHADFVTSTTHKTLRGPRGGIVLTNDKKLAKKVNSIIFPGMQGGPLMHVIAAKAVAFGEALKPDFKDYQKQVIANAAAMANRLKEKGVHITSGGTDNHLMIADLRHMGVTGQAAEDALEACGITCNKNAVPNDPQPPKVTSGIRLGSPAATSRGFKETEFEAVADMIYEVLDCLAKNPDGDSKKFAEIRQYVADLCARFPIYTDI